MLCATAPFQCTNRVLDDSRRAVTARQIVVPRVGEDARMGEIAGRSSLDAGTRRTVVACRRSVDP